MRILQEDSQKLIFEIYPTKTYAVISCFFVVLIILDFLGFSPTHDPVKNILGIFAEIMILANILILYLVPLRITIDKNANMFTYRDLTLFPTLRVTNAFIPPLYSYLPTISIPIDKLKKITFTNVLPELSNYLNWEVNARTSGKYSFVLQDNTSKDIYTGMFSLYRHKEACVKIADYLHIPYEETIKDGERALANPSTPFKKSPIVKILLWILFGLVVLLILFIAGAFLRLY